MNEPLERIKHWLQHWDGDLMGSQGALLGLDIGSYGLRVVLADVQGHQVLSESRPLPQDGPERVVAEALDLIRSVLHQAGMQPQHLVRIGIGFGGPVDKHAGTTRLSHRAAGWEHFPLAARFEEALDTPALLDNDANLIALAEATFGVGHNVQNLFYLHLSSGVGGGMVLDGRLYSGATSTAGEIGHAIVRYDGPPCSCGARGHLESYLSVGGLLRRANELGLRTDNLDDLFGESAIGRQVLAEATELLGMMLANIVTVLDPEMIVLGGVVTRRGGESFLATIQQRLTESLPPTMRRDVPVLASTFGFDSVAVGALALAAQSLRD
ncbi:ROK family protein [Kallotenue papyrolyticum]|uniref:ROK family protein n=1 Tax=Kallotenue papyrolyticum TaxID=1325125 RepID=UPI00047856D5|nr:ROK family protein [Kallotenue papyrolyticum]